MSPGSPRSKRRRSAPRSGHVASLFSTSPCAVSVHIYPFNSLRRRTGREQIVRWVHKHRRTRAKRFAIAWQINADLRSERVLLCRRHVPELPYRPLLYVSCERARDRLELRRRRPEQPSRKCGHLWRRGRRSRRHRRKLRHERCRWPVWIRWIVCEWRHGGYRGNGWLRWSKWDCGVGRNSRQRWRRGNRRRSSNLYASVRLSGRR